MHLRQPIVQRHVANDGDTEAPDDIQDAAGDGRGERHIGRKESKATTIVTAQSAPVPKNARKNSGLMTTMLMDCMAAIPSRGASRPRARMTKVEKA